MTDNTKPIESQRAEVEALKTRNTQLEAELSILANCNAQLLGASAASEKEIDLRQLWSALWAGKWLLAAITSIFSLAAILYALYLPNEYKSTAILIPASSSSASSLSKLAGQFGGLASLAGINLNAGGDDKATIAIRLMSTWGFQEKFIQDNHLQVAIFAAKGWNRATNKLIIDTDLYDPETKTWVRDFNPAKGETAKPSSWELYKKSKKMISVDQDKLTGLVSLSVEYYSPLLAKHWVDRIVTQINERLKEQDKKDAERNIHYLKAQIAKTNIADMQTVFYQLIEEQTKTLMLTEVSDEYVFKTVSHAKVSEEKDQPKRVLIIVFGFLIGGMLAVVTVLLRHFKRQG